MLSIFLANITTYTTHNPGDDGMRGPFPESFQRLVEATDVSEAEVKVRAAFEKSINFRIEVTVDVEISETIR